MAIAVVQTVSVTGTSVTSVTTAGITTTSGNLVILDFAYNNSTYTSLADNKSNTYTDSVAEITGVSGSKGRQQHSDSITGGASHTFTGTVVEFRSLQLVATEVSGQAASPFDVSVTHDTAFSTTHATGNTPTTTQANELLTGSCIAVNLQLTQPGAPWVSQQTLTILCTATQIVSSTGTYSATWTTATNDGTIEWITTWKAAAGDTLIGQAVL